MKLNLGCSDDQKPGYIGVDVGRPKWATPDNFQSFDLSGRMRHLEGILPENQAYPQMWLWPSSSIEEIFAHDVFEHIDNPFFQGSKGIIWCMNEAHRILKPGGILDLKVPCIDITPEGHLIGAMGVFCDPTHCQVWTADTIYYFDEHWNNDRGERGRLGPAYGITGLFKTVGGESYYTKTYEDGRVGPAWKPIAYAKDAPERRKLMLKLQAVK